MTKILVFILLQFSVINAKVFTVCELVTELNDLHLIPQNEIYLHLCIIGSMMNTNRSNGDFLGLYRIGNQWWCGKDSPGGNCNVKCSDLLDDDIADDVACAQKILDSHGIFDGWGTSNWLCKRDHDKMVSECLETIEDFENQIEWIETTTYKQKTKIVEELVQNLDRKVEGNDTIFNGKNFLIATVFIILIAIIVFLLVRSGNIERYFQARFSDSVRLL